MKNIYIRRMQKLAGLLTESQIQQLTEDEQELNRILDKISAKGKDSLSPEEKEWLDAHSKGEDTSKIQIGGPLKVLQSSEDRARFKVLNFPIINNIEDISFDCDGECETEDEWKELLKIKDFKKILEIIIKNAKHSSWGKNINVNNAFHGIEWLGDKFNIKQPEVNIQLSGDGYLYIMDSENWDKEDEEHFGLKNWKEVK